jgi:hypothetical protein
MIGAIRTRDIASHPWLTVRCFGWKTLFRALLAEENQSFLSLLSDGDTFSPTHPEAAALISQCVDLEIRAENIYLTLAEAAAEEPRLAEFFATLAEQEDTHAQLLQLCAAASKQCGWRLDVLRPWQDEVLRLEQEMCAAEAFLATVASVDDAMRLMIHIELSEVNHVFLAGMAASNSPFVKRLRPFQDAVDSHMSYISAQLAQLTPHLSLDATCAELPCSCCAE